MNMTAFSTWTLAEANAALPVIIRLTNRAQAQLHEIETVWNAMGFTKFDAIRGIAAEDVIRTRWAYRITVLGATPIGFFVVAFPSADSQTLLYWRHGESAVTREHPLNEAVHYGRRTIANGLTPL